MVRPITVSRAQWSRSAQIVVAAWHPLCRTTRAERTKTARQGRRWSKVFVECASRRWWDNRGDATHPPHQETTGGHVVNITPLHNGYLALKAFTELKHRSSNRLTSSHALGTYESLPTPPKLSHYGCYPWLPCRRRSVLMNNSSLLPFAESDRQAEGTVRSVLHLFHDCYKWWEWKEGDVFGESGIELQCSRHPMGALAPEHLRDYIRRRVFFTLK